MIAKLLQAGYLVDVCDIDPAAAKDVVEKGTGWQDLPRDAAGRDCEILITCLPVPHDVFDNMTGEQALWPECHRAACGSTRPPPTTTTPARSPVGRQPLACIR
ncbi:hypothetical protein NKI13_27175 [Mesorhizobium australicum]